MIYRRGADDGLWFGIYLSVLFVLLAGSIYSMLEAIVSIIMIMAVPVIIWFYLRRGYRLDNCRSPFSALWLHGICIFFFGSLLMSLTSYLYLRFYNPAYMNDLIETGKQFYGSIDSPESAQIVNILQNMQDMHMLPTAGESALRIIWTGVFTGSILSMLVSAIVRVTTRRPMVPPSTPA